MVSTNYLSLAGTLDAARIALVRAELARILGSPAFAGSKRSQDFFKLIVEHALAGRYDSLRERVIGAEMFGRPIDYDTANDAVVRVKASEVRRRLARYHAETREAAPVRIDLLTGSYEPKFIWPPPTIPAAGGMHSVPAIIDAALTPYILGRSVPLAPEPESVFSEKPHLRVRLRGLLIALGFLGLLVLGLLAYFRYTRNRAAAVDRLRIRTIAVLPIQNFSGDPRQEYLADGMTEELIVDLGQVAALRVTSRTSSMAYKSTTKALPVIARELHADAIVEGSIERKGDRIHFAIALVDARSDRELWTQTYDRDPASMLDLQREVAATIANRVRSEVTPRGQK